MEGRRGIGGIITGRQDGDLEARPARDPEARRARVVLPPVKRKRARPSRTTGGPRRATLPEMVRRLPTGRGERR